MTFKSKTEDMRDAPALALIAALQDCGARILKYDSEDREAAQDLIEEIACAP